MRLIDHMNTVSELITQARAQGNYRVTIYAVKGKPSLRPAKPRTTVHPILLTLGWQDIASGPDNKKWALIESTLVTAMQKGILHSTRTERNTRLERTPSETRKMFDDH